MIRQFTALDESDIMSATKVWMTAGDSILADLCRRFVTRDLLGIELQNSPFDERKVTELEKKAKETLRLRDDEIRFYVNTGDVYNQTYAPGTPEVRILLKNGTIKDITAVSDLFDKDALSEKVTKYYPLLSERNISEIKKYLNGIHSRNDSPVLNGTVEGDPETRVNTIAKIEEGHEGALSFLSNPKYEPLYLYDGFFSRPGEERFQACKGR